MQNIVIGQRLRQRRVELGLTQAQVAKKAKLSRGQLCYIESGKRRPSAVTLTTLSEILNCSIDWILKGTVPPNQPSSISETHVTENAKLQHVMEMYLYIDKEDQEEIEILLEVKCRKKENERNAMLSNLLQKLTDSTAV